MSLKSVNQIGSVASFIAIAIILVIGTVGGIYFVNQRGEQARKDETSRLADQLIQEENKDDNVSNPNGSTNTESTEVASNTSPVTVPTQQSGDLPSTGIEPDIIQVLAVCLLSASVTSFAMSRTSLRHPL
jgi:uncharacterized protein HemX